MARVLIIDDDIDSAKLLGEYLSQHNYQVAYEISSINAADRILNDQPDIVLLDLLMPVVDGLSVCRQVRNHFHNPIVILTGLQEEADIVTGLEVGADAYLTKPIKPRVLLAHIRAQLRSLPKKNTQSEDIFYIHCDDIVIDLKKRAVFKADEEVELTNAEYDLLAYLAQQRGQVIARNEIYQKLRKLEYNGLDRGID